MSYFAYLSVGVLALLVALLIGLLLREKSFRETGKTPVWPFYVTLVCSVMILVGILLGATEREYKTPVVIETASEPEIDTTIVTINGFSDTTYTYLFHNKIVE